MQEKIYKYNFTKEYTRYPGGRLSTHGPYSGEEFREKVLLPLLKEHEKVEIDLNGAVGYGATFIDEAFGELGHIYGFEEALNKVNFVCDDDPDLVKMIWEKIEKASKDN